MNTIKNLRKIRKDGKVITESTNLEETGWPFPCIITRIEWDFGDRVVSFDDEFGLICYVLPNRQAIVISRLPRNDDDDETITIHNADGTARMGLPYSQCIEGVAQNVATYGWFEKATHGSPDCFDLTLRTEKGLEYQMEMNGMTGEILGFRRIRW